MDFTKSARATLLYFDLFEYPLSGEELYRYFPSRISLHDFQAQIESTDVRSDGGFFHIRKDNSISEIRKKREVKARTMLRAASIMGRLLSHAPFVRAAFLSGSLSKGVNDGNADVDMFIITAENRLWVCRSILTMFKKTALLNSKKFLCLNYFVTEKHLEIPDRNIFTATELVTLRPLFNEQKLSDLLGANEWIKLFYPNIDLDGRYETARPSYLQRMLELPMNDGYTSRWDFKLMRYYSGLWKKRYPDTDSEKTDLLFRTTPFSSKVHPNDFQSRILDAYESRLQLENIKRLTRLDD